MSFIPSSVRVRSRGYRQPIRTYYRTFLCLSSSLEVNLKRRMPNLSSSNRQMRYLYANSALYSDSLDMKSPVLLDLPVQATLPSQGVSMTIPINIPAIQAPIAHQKCKSWVVFSDLHVKGSSIDVCEEVLMRVHEAAVSRNAGIIFLGDFWHVRGSLNVELLNRVLKALRKWIQPVIMIPGNHDQVTLGGSVHSLTPLLYAFHPDKVLLLDDPTICMGALWIPYRRDPALMQSILQQVALQSPPIHSSDSIDTKSTHNDNSSSQVSMIFCHADVRGAFMNDGMRSREGIDISCFPPHLPVYSGHFHKPHTISRKNSKLRYVGSPYQTSLSEAGQEKYFYQMNYDYHDHDSNNHSNENLLGAADKRRKTWREVDRWAVSIGSKIIKAESPVDPILLTAQSGDRVVMNVPLGQDYAAEKLLMKLREEKGVLIELRYENNPLPLHRKSNSAVAAGGDNKSSDKMLLTDETNKDNINHNNITNTTDVVCEDLDAKLDPIRIFMDYMGNKAETNVSLVENNINSNSITELQLTDETAVNNKNNHTTILGDDAAAVIHNAVILEGKSTIERVMGTVAASGRHADAQLSSSAGTISAVPSNNNNNKVFDLKLCEVKLSNFGPFGSNYNNNNQITTADSPHNQHSGNGIATGTIVYPLANRGLVLIRGQSNDGTGADSNGAGKTSLAMSVMWCLTGSLDARLVSDSKSADVAFDGGTAGKNDNKSKKKNRKKKKDSEEDSSNASNIITNRRSPVVSTTAEVTVTGFINQQPFELRRCRSAKKAELHFTVGDRVLTTQSVKDTQAVVDQMLGIGGGLLQRCCFFGQHTHTQHSLLGLSDVKLKSELSALVDTSIWITALQDVRSRERTAKTQLIEIAVINRLKREEVAKLQASYLESNTTLNSVQEQLAETKALLASGNLSSSSNISNYNHLVSNNDININNGTYQSVDVLTRKLTAIRSTMNAFKNDTVEVLRKNVYTLQSVRKEQLLQQCAELDDMISQLRVDIARLSSEAASNSSAIDAAQKKLSHLSLQTRNMTIYMEQREVDIKSVTPMSISPSTPIDSSSISVIDQLPMLQSVLEASVTELAAVNARIDSTNASLARLTTGTRKPLLSSFTITAASAGSSSSQYHYPYNKRPHQHYSNNNNNNANKKTTVTAASMMQDSDTACPTCGQELLTDSREHRIQTLRLSLNDLMQTQMQLIQWNNASRQRYEIAVDYASTAEQQVSFYSRIAAIETEISDYRIALQRCTEQTAACEQELIKRIEGKKLLLQEIDATDKEQLRELVAAEHHYKLLESEEDELHASIDKSRLFEEQLTNNQREANATMALLHERMNSTMSIMNEKKVTLDTLNGELDVNEALFEQLTNQVTVLDRLALILGPRGVLNYIFQRAIIQLENIANSYLMLLAEGGIQLALQSDATGCDNTNNLTIPGGGGNNNNSVESSSTSSSSERIVKTVWIRNKDDGLYKERALSQLSGGQWRRVSLALDLAFSELIRRKGVLRCNLLIMDEVLTHLDASGREAVGTVLRSMVHRGGDSNKKDSSNKSKRTENSGTDNNNSFVNNDISVTIEQSRDSDNAKEDDVLVESDDDNTTGGNNASSSSLNKDKRTSWMLPGSSSNGENAVAAYETVIVILQDLAAAELEEAFDHVDVVVRGEENSSIVILDGQQETITAKSDYK